MGFPSPLRKSHLQPPSTSSHPPTSFSRSGGSTFRDSLRKIPSTIFAMRGDAAKKDIERKKSIDKLGSALAGLGSGRPRQAMEVAPSVKMSDVGKENNKESGNKEKKAKTKTRKALGELFGWGNTNSSSHSAVIPAPTIPTPSAPSPLRATKPPTPPSKYPTPPTKDHTIRRKAPPGVLSKKASTNTFGTFSSIPANAVLRAPSPIHDGRPSLGEDPFSRVERGAEVVEVVQKRDITSPSIKSDFSVERRRDSIYSSKALSTKTVASDEVSVHEVAMRARMSSPRRITMASVIEEKRRMSSSPSRPISSTAPTLRPLIAPPPRIDSLRPLQQQQQSRQQHLAPALAPRVRIINDPRIFAQPITSAPTPPAPQSIALPTPFDRNPSALALKKEKTKSRVWGFLGKKTGKGKEDKENEVPPIEVPPVPMLATARPIVLGNKIQPLQHRDSQPNYLSRPTIIKARSPAVPVFHISHPSTDTSTATCADSPSPMPFTKATPLPIIKPASLRVEMSSTNNKRDSGSTIASLSELIDASKRSTDSGDSSDARHCAQLLAGSKALPKRKSLNGLFGLSIKSSNTSLREQQQQQQQQPISAKSIYSDQSAFDWTPPKLRPLSEEMDEMTFGTVKTLGKSNLAFGRDVEPVKHDPGLRRVASATDKLINLVTTFDFSPAASPANSRLGAISSFNSLRAGKNRTSSSPTPIRKVQSAMLFKRANQSPSSSPVKAETNVHVSPLKYVLHRAHVRKMDGVSIFGEQPAPRVARPPLAVFEATSLVKKGMRNPFAPPSPERSSTTTRPIVQAPPVPAVPIITLPPVKKRMTTMTFGPALGLAGEMGQEEEEDGGDFPADLRAMLAGSHMPKMGSVSRGDTILPPHARLQGKQNGGVAPGIALPPVPPLPPNIAANTCAIEAGPERPTLSVETDVDLHADVDEYEFEERYITPASDHRDSFDFTNECEDLDRGTHRASFVEALHRVGSSDMLNQHKADLPPLPPLPPRLLYTIEQSPDSVRTLRGGSTSPTPTPAPTQAEAYADAVEGTRRSSPARQRKAPFQGTFAFQQQVSQNKGALALTPPIPSPAEEAEAEPVVPVNSRYTRNHQREISVMTTSSLGEVIDTAENAREYTNYFEVNFAQHLAQNGGSEMRGGTHSRNASVDSIAPTVPSGRAPTRRNNHHHRRNSSIISVESIGITGIPPISALNKQARQSGYISKHRRDMSSDSARGRSDWASHRRNISTTSTASDVSVSRIGRPGLGERMFQLDGGVRLSPITGSPPDAAALASGRMHAHSRVDSWNSLGEIGEGEVSFDTLFDGPTMPISPDSVYDNDGHVRQVSIDSLFDESAAAVSSASESDARSGDNVNRYSSSTQSTDVDKRSSATSESIFGADADTEEAVIKQGFFLRGIRPVSALSSGMSSETGEDTFIDVKRYVRRAAKEEVFEGKGEDRMTPIQETLHGNSGTHSLSGSISRPAKPNSVRRRRPAHLVFGAYDPETPGLTSPSTSETSSRISLDTRFSSEHGLYSIGHNRQKSSAHIIPPKTIREEPSIDTLRPPPSRLRPRLSRENLRRQDARVLASDDDEAGDNDSTESITAWLRFQREADAVCKQTKSDFRDSVQSKAAMAGFQAKFSPQSVADFLAKSAAAYKPLDTARPVAPINIRLQRDQGHAHRRKNSLADSRSLLSPYGLPSPLPPFAVVQSKPRGSLTTKFERSNSTQSNRSSEDGSGGARVSTPQSGMFAHFMSDLVPSPISGIATTPRATSIGPSPFSAARAGKVAPDYFNLGGTVVPTKVKASDPPPRTMGLTARPENAGSVEGRTRVDSSERRKALGWGRRRNSDGPEKVIQQQQGKVVPIGSGPASKSGSNKTPSAVFKDKENTTIIKPAIPISKPSGNMSSRKYTAVRPAMRATPNAGKALRA